MAFNDYQYVGYTDEKIVTNLILSNLSRVMRARRDREQWLDSLALQISSATDTPHVKGGGGMTKIERRVEQQDTDKVLKALMKIELTVTARIKSLSPREQMIIRESYLNTVQLRVKDICKKYNLKQGAVSTAKKTALRKLTAPCVRVYREFCLWRAFDDKELAKRIKQSDEEIKKELEKKIGVA